MATLQSLILTTSQETATIALKQSKELEERTIMRENANASMIIQQIMRQ